MRECILRATHKFKLILLMHNDITSLDACKDILVLVVTARLKNVGNYLEIFQVVISKF